MAELTIEEKLLFHYDPHEQRSPQWLKRKQGKIGASRLEDWLAVSKAKGKEGTPLKARLDYEKELMFERQFDTHFEVFVNGAMQDGIDYEGFAAEQFAAELGVEIAEVGCWYNQFMAVSPDRVVFPAGTGVTYLNDLEIMPKALGVVEIKIVKDNTFTEILMSGVPSKHMKQIQAQLKATGLTKGWYVALNFNTKRYVIIEVEADAEFQEYMMEAVQEQLVVEPFALDYVHTIKGEIPSGVELGAPIDRSDSNVDAGGF
jgi:hypothetical protein